MLDVRRLRMLAALHRLGTVAAVADELHLTPPGVSMQLAALERETGVALTRRQGRRLVLTPAGVVLAGHGEEILDRISRAELEVEALRAGTTGTYAVAAFPSAARTFVAQAFGALLRDEGAALEVRLSTPEPEGALAALASGDADLAVVHSYSNVPRTVGDDLVVRDLGAESVRLAVPAGPSASARLADYAQHAWVAPEQDVTCAEMVERACGLAGFRPRVVARSLDFAVQLELVAAGLGVALVPELTVDRLPDGVQLLDLDSPVRRHVQIATRAARVGDRGLRRIADAVADAARTRLG